LLLLYFFSFLCVSTILVNKDEDDHTLSTRRHDHHQQHLPKISQNVSVAVWMAIRYGRNTCTVR